MGKVPNGLFALGATKQPTRAAVVGFALFPLGQAATHRAVAHHGELRRVKRTAVQHHRHHLWDHIACPAHDDGVSHPHVFSARFQLVVQRGIGHRDPPHKHRGQFGHGREFAGAAHLNVDGQHRGHFFLRGVLVRHGPTWLAGHKTQASLQRQAVDFVDDAVDVVRQGIAFGGHTLVKRHQPCSTLHTRGLLGHRKAPSLQLHEHVVVGSPLRTAFVGRRDVAQAISKKAQRPFSRNARVELAHRTRRRVARIDEGFFTFGACGDALALALVQGFEIVAAHVDLAAHFEHAGGVGRQPQGDLPDGADVAGDVFARFPIASGRRLHQHAALVTQAHGQAVKFEFAHIVHSRVSLAQPQLFANAGVKGLGPAGFGVGLGADAQHGHAVLDLGKRVQDRPADTLARRVRCQQFGVCQFQRLQFAKQTVVFGVGDFWRIQRVVGMRVVVQLASQGLSPSGWAVGRRRSRRWFGKQAVKKTWCVRAQGCVAHSREQAARLWRSGRQLAGIQRVVQLLHVQTNLVERSVTEHLAFAIGHDTVHLCSQRNSGFAQADIRLLLAGGLGHIQAQCKRANSRQIRVVGHRRMGVKVE